MLIRAKILDVRLHQRRVLAKRLHFHLLLRHNFVQHLAKCRRLLCGCGQRQRTKRKGPSQDVQGTHNGF